MFSPYKGKSKWTDEEFKRIYNEAIDRGRHMLGTHPLKVYRHGPDKRRYTPNPFLSKKKLKMSSRSRSRSIRPRGRPPVTPANTLVRGRSRTRTPMNLSRSRTRSRRSTTRGSSSMTVATAGRSGGRFSSGSKSWRNKKLVKYAVKGTNLTTEGYGVINAVDCMWLGHATCASNQVLRQAIKTIFQYFIRLDGINPQDSDQLVMSPGDNIIVEYQVDAGAPLATDVYVVPVGGTTMNLFATWFLENTRPWYNNPQVLFSAMYTSSTTSNSQIRIRLNDIKCYLHVKSALKIQNRSFLTTGNIEADDIDNIPIYGKSYDGKGNTLRPKKHYANQTIGTPIILTADHKYGVIANAAIDAANHMKEPPQGRDFINVKKQGKAHLEPGQIKTSVLSDTFSMLFNTLWYSCQPDFNALARVARFRYVGSFRVFALEKMIETTTAGTLSAAYEVNNEISCTVKQKNRAVVVKEFVKAQVNPY